MLHRKIHVTNSGGSDVAAVFVDGIGQNGQNRKMSQLLAVGGDDEAAEGFVDFGRAMRGTR